jgi:hypothetical protein
MWVLFLRNYPFRPPERRGVTVLYKSGMIKFVRRICGERAIAEGKAVLAERPN